MSLARDRIWSDGKMCDARLPPVKLKMATMLYLLQRAVDPVRP
jgi:hypothetical protein